MCKVAHVPLIGTTKNKVIENNSGIFFGVMGPFEKKVGLFEWNSM